MRLTTWLIAVFCLVLVPSPLVAADQSDGSGAAASGAASSAPEPAPAPAVEPPRITEHSLTEVAVHQGDELVLGVTAAGQGVQYRWEKDGQIFCRAPACQISTANFGVGLFRFTVVASNAGGTCHLEFVVHVVRAPLEHRPAVVSPRRVRGQDAYTVGPDDWALMLLKGRAKLEQAATIGETKSRELGSFALPLDWAAKPKIETGTQSAIELGRKGQTQFVALEQTEIELESIDAAQVVTLRRGLLRVRQLASNSSAQKFKLGADRELSVGVDADLLVDLGADLGLRIYVLRGDATLTMPVVAPKEKTLKLATVKLGYGQALTVPPAAQDLPEPSSIPVNTVQPLVIATSRDYLPEYLAEWSQNGPFRVLHTKAKTPAEAKVKAREYNASHDYFAAVEVLAPFWKTYTQDADALVLMALAYSGMFLQDDAMNLLRDAAKIAPNAPSAFFQMGELHARVGNWRQAARAYAAAASRDDPNPKQVQFKLGDAWGRIGADHEAARAYKRVAWYPPVDDLTQESVKRLDELNDKRTFTADIGTTVFYDSNILRVGQPKIVWPDSTVTSNYGAGYKGDVDLRVWPYRGADGWTYFGLSAQFKDYIKPPNRNLATSWQRLNFASELGLWGDRASRYLTIGIDGSFGYDMIASTQQLTRLNGALIVGSPWLYGLTLRYQRSFLVDPQPGRERMIEPIRWELGAAGDYGAMVALYQLQATPWERDDWRVRLGGRSRRTAYRNSAMKKQSFSDTGFDLNVSYEPQKRSGVTFAVSNTSRRFAMADDQRSDQDLVIGCDLGFSITPDVRQTLGLSYEAQTSSRGENSFKRKYVSYQLMFNL